MSNDQFSVPEPVDPKKRPRSGAMEAPDFAPPSGALWGDVGAGGQTPRQAEGMTPTPLQVRRQSRWGRGATPTPLASGTSRWNQATPSFAANKLDATPTSMTPGAEGGATPVGVAWGPTPAMADGSTPQQGQWFDASAPFSMFSGEGQSGGQFDVGFDESQLDAKTLRQLREMRYRNRYLTDEELDAVIPPGYAIVQPPEDYLAKHPLKDPEMIEREREALEREKKQSTMAGAYDIPESLGEGIPALRPEDVAFFELLLQYQHAASDDDIPKEDLKKVLILRNLLKVKNGDSKQRKSGLRLLTEKAKYFGGELLFQYIFELWMSDTLEGSDKHILIKLMDRVMFKLGSLIAPQVKRALQLIQPLLSDPDPYNRAEGKEVIGNLARAAGRVPIMTALRADVDDDSEDIRQLTARTMAVVAQALGVDQVLPFIQHCCTSVKSWKARHTGLKIITEMASLMGNVLRKHLRELIECLARTLNDEQTRVKHQAAISTAALAEAVAPYGIEEFNNPTGGARIPIMEVLLEEAGQYRGKVLTGFVRAIGCVFALMEGREATDTARRCMDIIIRSCQSPDEELRRAVLRVIQQVVGNPGISAQFIRAQLTAVFFEAFWATRIALDKRNAKQLIDTTVDIGRKVGTSDVLHFLIQKITDFEADYFQRTALEALQKVVEHCGTLDVYEEMRRKLVDAVFSSYESDSNGMNSPVIYAMVAVTRSLNVRMAPHLSQLMGIATNRLSHVVPQVRKQAGELIHRIAKSIVEAKQGFLLPTVAATLIERLSSEDVADALAAVISALHAILSSLPDPWEIDLKNLLTKLCAIVKNPSEDVQENTVLVIGEIARIANIKFVKKPDSSDSGIRVLFFQLAKDGLFYLLKSKRKTTRVATAETFGEVATAITPLPVVKHLLNNLKKEERKERICTEVALAVVAKRCHPFVVIPFLVNEFRASQGTALAETTQHAVLKTLRFLFEYLGGAAAKYVDAVIPLLEWSLTEKCLQHRRMATEVVRHIALSFADAPPEESRALGAQETMVHLLNYLHPNLIPTTTGSEQMRLTTAVAEVVEASQQVVAAGALIQYLYTGLFHPARKVRESYWRMYNVLYLAAGDKLVPFFPSVPDEGVNHYEHWHLTAIV